VLGPHLDAGGAERHVDRPDLVGPQHGRPGLGKPRENLRRRMPVVVPGADRYRRQARARRGHQLLGRRRPAPVVAGLEQVDRGETPGDQLRLDVRLGVPRQEEAPALEGAEQDDRGVVHLAAVVGRSGRDAVGVGPEHVEADPVERESVARGEAAARRPPRREDRRERLVPRASSGHPGLHDPPDAVALQDERQARDVVLVGVGQHDEVDPPVPRGHPRVERNEKPVGVRAAVHEHPAARRAGHQDRVALSDVEDDDVGPAVGSRGAGHDEHGHGKRAEQARDPKDPR